MYNFVFAAAGATPFVGVVFVNGLVDGLDSIGIVVRLV